MLIVGLTGSIGMGKSAVAAMLREAGVPVFDADAVVHALYAGDGAKAIEVVFPGVVVDGAVDRAELSKKIVGDAAAYRRLESIIHPLVRGEQTAFLQAEFEKGAGVVVLEIPLLFESGGDKRCDATIAVSAPYEVQRQRVLERPGMTQEKFEELVARQMPDREKRQRADFIVDTDVSLEETQKQITHILQQLESWPATAYAAHWSGRSVS